MSDRFFNIGVFQIPITRMEGIYDSPCIQVGEDNFIYIDMLNEPLTNVHIFAILTKIYFERNCKLFLLKFNFLGLYQEFNLFLELLSLIGNLLYILGAGYKQFKEVRIFIENFNNVGGITYNSIKRYVNNLNVENEDIKLITNPHTRQNTISITMYAYDDEISGAEMNEMLGGLLE